ncbi:hypothetical protein H6P81_000876 [Aristolochia fimbriata]|uniref:Afadin-and alpha-actinin-binding protein n=1 Tax=Aristolochia fimbriata TaxID=158543 RepID=A0AAV7F5M3_ARIFI|nr:hypothetical protein H6P81_000876 [Aristolochia fimbriata]
MSATDLTFNLTTSNMHPGLGFGEYAFADVGNLEHCTKYLNQTLVTYGFPASLDLFANDPVSIARTCNCIYSLLQQRQRDMEFKESTNEQRQRLQSDISRLEGKIERLEAQIAAKEREIATMTRTEAKATAAFKAQIEKLQQERDEFQKMVIGNQQVRTQQLHEMKKREKEYVKLQERLNQVLMEKKKESRSGMEIMNLLQKEGRQRGTWNGKKADSDFYKMIADAYEAKKQELMAENGDLRASLRSLQMEVRDLLNAPTGLPKQISSMNEKHDIEPPQSPLGGKTDVFDLPFHMARDQIEESLRTKMASIKERMVQLQDAQKGAEVSSEATERELELEAQLVEAQSIIQEQASIMSKHLSKRVNNHLGPNRGSNSSRCNRGSMKSQVSFVLSYLLYMLWPTSHQRPFVRLCQTTTAEEMVLSLTLMMPLCCGRVYYDKKMTDPYGSVYRRSLLSSLLAESKFQSFSPRRYLPHLFCGSMEVAPPISDLVDGKTNASQWEFTCDLDVDYGSQETASIVYSALAVDKELQPDKVKRQMSISAGRLSIHFEAVESRFLRASFSAFVDVLTLATKTIEEFGSKPDS